MRSKVHIRHQNHQILPGLVRLLEVNLPYREVAFSIHPKSAARAYCRKYFLLLL